MVSDYYIEQGHRVIEKPIFRMRRHVLAEDFADSRPEGAIPNLSWEFTWVLHTKHDMLGITSKHQ